MDEHQKQFVKLVEELSYMRSNVFRDFCELSAISLANALGTAQPVLQNDVWKDREKRYLDIVKQYKPAELPKFGEMLACVVNSLSDGDEFNFHDCLGELHMSDEITGRSNWDSDVCFTPKEVSFMMAKMTFTGLVMPEKGYILISEPACGAGSMIIQACRAFKELGFNFQKQMHVTAVEIRSMIAHMAYIQFSLLHIPAVVVHGDTLALKEWSAWETPAHTLGFWDFKLRRDCQENATPECQQKLAPKKGQVAFDFELPSPIQTKGEEQDARRRKTKAVA
jgi:hypothetical protein